MKKENALWRRKHVLERLGLHTHASRSAWSHDLAHAIVFDAWDHQWQRDAGGTHARYPLRTNGEHYNLAEAVQNPGLVIPVGNDTSTWFWLVSVRRMRSYRWQWTPARSQTGARRAGFHSP